MQIPNHERDRKIREDVPACTRSCSQLSSRLAALPHPQPPLSWDGTSVGVIDNTMACGYHLQCENRTGDG
jgi:hypothetical protein